MEAFTPRVPGSTGMGEGPKRGKGRQAGSLLHTKTTASEKHGLLGGEPHRQETKSKICALKVEQVTQRRRVQAQVSLAKRLINLCDSKLLQHK